MENKGASVVITHAIIEGKEKEYENWLAEISPLSKASPGFIDIQIIRPIPTVTFEYNVIIRFDHIDNLKSWIGSSERKRLIEKALPFFAKEDQYRIKSGLDFLFAEENGSNKVPVRWKQYLATWSAIFPLSIFVPLLILPALRILGVPQNHYFDGLIISGCIVLLMIYLVMPNYTRLIQKWLYR